MTRSIIFSFLFQEHGALDLFQKSRNIGNNFIKIDTTYLNNMHEHKEAFHNEHKEIFENCIRLNNTLSVMY
ncbi:hypothetical protein TKK_0010307 [Trichogramma kaykai]